MFFSRHRYVVSYVRHAEGNLLVHVLYMCLRSVCSLAATSRRISCFFVTVLFLRWVCANVVDSASGYVVLLGMVFFVHSVPSIRMYILPGIVLFLAHIYSWCACFLWSLLESSWARSPKYLLGAAHSARSPHGVS